MSAVLGAATRTNSTESPVAFNENTPSDVGGHMMSAMQTAEPSGEDEMPEWAASSNPVIHWEIASRSAAAVRDFYTAVFGWELSVDDPYGYGEVGCSHPFGIGGGIGDLSADEEMPETVSFYVGVADLQSSLDLAGENGATTVLEPTNIMEGLDIAFFVDPQGNAIGLIRLNEQFTGPMPE